MTIKEKIESATNGTVSDITIVSESTWYVVVEYILAGVTCQAEVIR